jgi:hypothetical protein
LSPSPHETHFVQLDVSVETSGPHGFAVRFIRTPCEETAATAACPAFVAIASRPSLLGQDARRRTNDFARRRKAENLTGVFGEDPRLSPMSFGDVERLT